MIGYHPACSFPSSNQALKEAGWKVLISPRSLDSKLKVSEGRAIALDNGAWSCHQKGKTLDIDTFLRMLYRLHERAEWYVLPDIVEGGFASLKLSLYWLNELDWAKAEPMLAVQDGIMPEDLDNLPINIFVGGSTQWKEQTMGIWADYAHSHGKLCHVGRVNSRRRLELCHASKVDSFDGSGPVRFSRSLKLMTKWLDDINNRSMGLPVRGA